MIDHSELATGLLMLLIVLPLAMACLVAIYYEIRYRCGLQWQRSREERNRMMGIQE